MQITPKYYSPLFGLPESKLDPTLWQSVREKYEAKKYKEALFGLFDYIDKSILKEKTNKEQTEFKIPHGPILFSVQLQNEVLTISLPFLTIPDKKNLGLLRQISEVNFSTLVLSQIVLKDDQFWFEFSCPLELFEPYKIYDVFTEICHAIINLGGLYEEKFGARIISPREVKKLSQAEMDKAWNTYQDMIKEGLEYASYFEKKNMPYYACDFLNFTLTRIVFYLEPQGFLGTEIKEGIEEMYKKQSMNETISKTKGHLQKLQQISREKFEKSLYYPEYFISPRRKAGILDVQNILKKSFDYAKEELNHVNYSGAATNMIYNLYDLFYKYDLPKETAQNLSAVLQNSSQKNWKEAADILWKEMDLTIRDVPHSATPNLTPQKKELRDLMIVFAVLFGAFLFYYFLSEKIVFLYIGILNLVVYFVLLILSFIKK